MVICVDFDGTCVTHEFPEVGRDIGAQKVLRRLVNEGHRLVLFTMRSDKLDTVVPGEKELKAVEPKDYLADAVNWFKKNNIPLFGINTNPSQSKWTSSPKAYGQLYIDDCALGVPLIRDRFTLKPYVNWVKIEKMLIERGVLAGYRK